ncbi:MAG: TlpA disulfide reductase family protein [Alistipes sp.]
MDFIGKNGDTILINTTGDTPGISVKNRMSWGVNYDWERELRFGRLYDYTPETLVNAESILFLKSMREKFDFNSAKIKVNQAMQNNNGNESLWLDSLYRVNRLDSVEYRYYKTRNHYQRLNMELRHKTKSDLESILSAYSDSMYRNDFYLFYRDYFDAAAKQYYYDKTIQLSNGSDYDFKNAYQRIEQDTLLSGNLRDAHLYYCFRQIDKIFSITDGKKYYDKVVKSIIDTAILNSLHRDYDKLYAHKIQYSNDLALQNRKGVATTLQKVIAANRGKVVYVDFWASWCVPCMEGMPASKQLRNDYKSKDVVFVYLAFNDKDAAWRGAIPKAELDLVEHNYLVTNPRTSAMVEKLKLKTIPRYLLYDKSGHLVNENAPRPESQEIRAALNRYL